MRISVALISGLVFVAVAAAPTHTARGASQPSFDLSQALRFRSNSGLSTDIGFVESVAANAGFDQKYGTPLNEDETAEMDRRVSIQSGLDPLTNALIGDSDFGGLYIDKLTGDVVITGRGDGVKELALAAALLPSQASWRFQPVVYTLSELAYARSRIAANEEVLEASLGLSAVGVDTVTNRVTVGLDPYTDSAARTIRAMYGDIVEVQSIPIASPTTCTRADCPSPSMKGGLVISAVFNGPICTSGFGANLSSGGSSNVWYLMTAGHCLYNNGGNGIYWTHALSFPDGIYIGKSQSYLFANHAIADVGIIKFDAWDTPTNVVYRSCGTCLTSIVARASNAGQPLGALACFSGQSSGYPCGHIDQVQMDHVISGGWTMNNQWRIDITALSGDSGGPVLAGSNAMGILSSGATNQTWYSTIDWMNNALGYRPCISATANPCT